MKRLWRQIREWLEGTVPEPARVEMGPMGEIPQQMASDDPLFLEYLTTAPEDPDPRKEKAEELLRRLNA